MWGSSVVCDFIRCCLVCLWLALRAECNLCCCSSILMDLIVSFEVICFMCFQLSSPFVYSNWWALFPGDVFISTLGSSMIAQWDLFISTLGSTWPNLAKPQVNQTRSTRDCPCGALVCICKCTPLSPPCNRGVWHPDAHRPSFTQSHTYTW